MDSTRSSVVFVAAAAFALYIPPVRCKGVFSATSSVRMTRRLLLAVGLCSKAFEYSRVFFLKKMNRHVFGAF